MSRCFSLGFRFGRAEHGSVAVVFAISAVVLIGIAGVAVDYSRWYNTRTSLQAAVDSAVLGSAHLVADSSANDDNIKVDLKRYMAQNGFAAGKLSAFQATIDRTNDTLALTASVDVAPTLSKVLTGSNPTVSASAKARLKPGGDPLCVLALDPSMDKALEGSGGSSFNANACTVQVNSSSSKAVNLSGGGSITSSKNCIVGGVDQGYSNITPAPEASCDAIPDPFAALPKPTVGSCNYNNFSANTPQTLSPGVYCGGLTLQNVAFTLDPGLYIVKDGTFTLTGGAQITGDGVTFFLTGTNAGVVWSGGGSYHLSAMKTGELAGFVVYLDPNALAASKSVISGGGATYYEGVMYFPNQKLEISGTGSVTTPSPFTAFVANNILFSGGSTLTIGIDKTKTDIPIPTGLYNGTGGPVLMN